MEKKYLYRMALVALWMAPVTSLQAAKAVEESHYVDPTGHRLSADDEFRTEDLGAKAVKDGGQVWYVE